MNKIGNNLSMLGDSDSYLFCRAGSDSTGITAWQDLACSIHPTRVGVWAVRLVVAGYADAAGDAYCRLEVDGVGEAAVGITTGTAVKQMSMTWLITVAYPLTIVAQASASVGASAYNVIKEATCLIANWVGP